MSVSPPFAISETLPADSDLISIFPTQEHPFRDTVESWLTFISDPATGLLKPAAFPTYVTSWVVQALDASSDAVLSFKDNAGVLQSKIIWNHTNDFTSIVAYQDDGTTIRTQIDIKGDAAEVNVVTGVLKVGGNTVLDPSSAVATAITGTGALNAGSITSGFGSINIGTDALTAGAASFTSMASSGAVSGTTATFSGAVSGTAGTFSSTVTANQNFASSTTSVVLATSAAGTVFLRPNGAGSATGQMTVSSAGNVTAAGDITASSDRRLKKSISPLNALWASDMVREVQPMTFLRKKNDQRGIGFIAQDVEGYAPELIQKDARGYLSLAYPNMVAILWKVVQGLQERLDKLEAK